MKAEFTKCWTCPPALPGKPVTLLLLLHRCARRPRIWRASSSCWNSGAGAVDEALRDLSACRARQHLRVSSAQQSGRRTRLGECLPGRSAPPPTFSPFASHLRLRPPRFRPLVRTATSTACRDHRVHARRLCPSSTRAGSQAYAANCESSAGHSALLLSLPHRSRNSRRPSAFPAPLYQTIAARLRPASPRHRPGTSPQTRSAGDRAALGPRSREVLAELPHLSRFGSRGLDAPRRLALL